MTQVKFFYYAFAIFFFCLWVFFGYGMSKETKRSIWLKFSLFYSKFEKIQKCIQKILLIFSHLVVGLTGNLLVPGSFIKQTYLCLKYFSSFWNEVENFYNHMFKKAFLGKHSAS